MVNPAITKRKELNVINAENTFGVKCHDRRLVFEI